MSTITNRLSLTVGKAGHEVSGNILPTVANIHVTEKLYFTIVGNVDIVDHVGSQHTDVFLY